jgi:formate hydrogenlyase subunit 4
MIALTWLAHLAALTLVAPVVSGLVVRTKSWWAGRRGPPILQPAWDVLRLLRKTPVYSATTTPVFRAAPWVALGATAAASLVVPMFGAPALTFPGDFLLYLYAGAIGRVALMLGALDTGSPFEGMGASREATYSTLLEPAMFLVIGAAALAAGATTLADVVHLRAATPAGWMLWSLTAAVLALSTLVESARMPVDDPTTHLELTMIHEVMILDHSGPELAALQAGASIKLMTGLWLLGALLVPGVSALPPAALWAAKLAMCLALAVALGTLESLTARLRLTAIPSLLLVGATLATAALFAGTAVVVGGAP